MKSFEEEYEEIQDKTKVTRGLLSQLPPEKIKEVFNFDPNEVEASGDSSLPAVNKTRRI